MSSPIAVGITGGIGAGKTLTSRLFSLLNIPVYNADSRAKGLMNTQLVKEISNEFGKKSYSDGQLNRDYLASNVFSNKKALEKLNKIVHPAVANDFNLWMELHNNYVYVLKEAALLVETNSFKKLDRSEERRVGREC